VGWHDASGQEAGYTLGWPTFSHRANREKKYSLSPTVEFMFLARIPGKIHVFTEHANSTQKDSNQEHLL